MRLPALLLCLTAVLTLLHASPSGAAPDPTAEHRALYSEINGALKTMAQKRFTVDLPGAPVEPEGTAWISGGMARKIRIVYPSDHGQMVQDFYYSPGADLPKLMFVYEVITTQTVNGTDSSGRENRYYFQDGQMIRWLDEDRRAVPTDIQDFTDREQEVMEASSMALEALGATGGSGKTGTNTQSGTAGPVTETTGVFMGIESGDYSYLLLKSGKKEISYMILETDAALDRLVANPDRYTGRTITVLWQTAQENIPEAGGMQTVTKAVSVRLTP